MNGIAEVSATYIYWLHCVKLAKFLPNSIAFQKQAAHAQAQHVMVQAEYLAGGTQ